MKSFSGTVMKEKEVKEKEKKPRRFTFAAFMLIIAAVALAAGIIVPPVFRSSESRAVDADCRKASQILEAVKTAAADADMAQKITAAGYAGLTWTAADGQGVITCDNVPDLQTAVTNAVPDITRDSKTLAAATWTVNVGINPDGSFAITGAWSGSVVGNDTELTKKSGQTQ